MNHDTTYSAKTIWKIAFFVMAQLIVGCSSSQIGSPSNVFEVNTSLSDKISFPEEYKSENANFFVHNEIEIAAPPEIVWDILVKAEEWAEWYEGALNVKVLESSDGKLHTKSVFNWQTMGFDFTSTVHEFQPPFRLSWESRKWSIQGYHGWLLIPTDTGCKVVTEEGFQGILGWLQGIFIPNKLHNLHEIFLTELKKKSEAMVR
jgi:uncharacterized protein YndB with AHSA1/START domain